MEFFAGHIDFGLGFGEDKTRLEKINNISNKICFIGDLHGRFECLRDAHIVAKDFDASLVCVGDVLDSFDRSTHDMLRCFDYCEENGIPLLPGNHCLGYVGSPFSKCSGFDQVRSLSLSDSMKSGNKSYRQMIAELPSLFIIKPDGFDNSPEAIENGHKNLVLATHAGLSGGFVRTHIDNEHTFMLKSNKYGLNGTIDESSLFHAILKAKMYLPEVGTCRGGIARFGGIFWSDFKYEFSPIPGLDQVFGHSRVRGVEPRIEARSFHSKNMLASRSFAIDCLDSSSQVLMLDFATNDYKIINF